MNESLYKKWFVIFLTGYLLSLSLTFIFPLMIVILMSSGFSAFSAGLTQACALLISSFLMPYVGSLLDQGKFLRVLSSIILFLGLGLLGFFKEDWRFAVVMGSIFFTFSAGATNVCVTRFTEGLAASESIAKNASATYMVTNIGLGISAVVAYFFLQEHQNTLIALDMVTCSFFIVFLMIGYKKISISTTKSAPIKINSLQLLRRNFTFSLSVILFFITHYAHVSALPMMYFSQGLNAKQMQALVMGGNTLAVILCSFFLGKFISPKNHYRILFSTSFLAVIAHVFFPYWTSSIGVFVLAALGGVAEAAAYPVVTDRILKLFPTEERGIAVGFRDMLLKWSLILAPLVGSIMHLKPIYFSIFFGLSPILGLMLYKIQNIKE